MKKLICLLLAICQLFTLAACSSSKPGATTASPETTEAKPKATVIVNINVEGLGRIAYAEGENTPEIDTDFVGEYQCGRANARVDSFAYVHDPKDNPEAMKDIIENPDAR